MRIQKLSKPHVVKPVICGEFHKCVCGNRVYYEQKVCEICESVLDWSNIIVGIEAIKKRKCKNG